MRSPNSEDFGVLLASADVVVVHFDATWDEHRHGIQRQFELLRGQTLPNLALAYVDVDAHPDVAREHRVLNVPTVFYCRAGKVVDQVTGANQDVLARVSALLHIPSPA